MDTVPFVSDYARPFPQLVQNLPVLTAPQEQVHCAEAGLGEPQLVQNFPVLVAPQEQVQLSAGAGLGEPQLVQNFPVLVAPQEQVQPFAGAAAACCAAC